MCGPQKNTFSIFSPVFMDGPATHSVTEDIYEAEAAVAASAAAVERLASQVRVFPRWSVLKIFFGNLR